MSSIDERIVEMKFNNGQFQTGIDQSTQSLEKLKAALNLESAANSLDAIQSKFNVFGAIGFSAINNLTNMAMESGRKIYDAVVEPLIKGGERRSQNFAQAEFQLKGLGVVGEDLTKVMDAASYAVNGTAYGLDQAAVAASSFVASNVPIDQLAYSLRGISGVAAMTGRDFGDISQIFTTVAGNGRLFATELNRIGASGVNAAAALAKSLGVTETEVRKMTSDGKINFATFAKAMDEAFGEQATKANDLYSGSLSNMRAALARIGEPIADGKFEKLRLTFNALTPIINNVKNAMMPLLKSWKFMQIDSGKATATMLEGLSKGALSLENLKPGFDAINRAFINIIQIGKKFTSIFKDVWKDAFPNKSNVNFLTILGNALEKVTKAFRNADGIFIGFRVALTAILNVASILWSVFSGGAKILFAIIQVFVELGKAIWDLITPFTGANKAASGTADTMQDFFSMIKEAVDKYVPIAVEWINKFRDSIASLRDGGSSGVEWIDNVYNAILNFKNLASEKIPEFFDNLKNSISDFFNGINIQDSLKNIFDSFGNIKLDGLVSVETAGDQADTAWGRVKTTLERIWEWLEPLRTGITDAIDRIKESVKGMFDNVGADEVLAAINAAVLTGGIIGLVKAFREIAGVNTAIKDMLGSIGGTFDQLTSYFKTLQNEIKINAILKIAVAIGIIAGSIWLLAQIPAGQLWSAVGAITALAAVLAGLAILMDKTLDMKSVVKLEYLSKAMFVMAAALGVMAYSIKMLSDLSWEDLAKGIIGVAAGMALLVGSLIAVSRLAGDAKFIGAAVGIGIVALSMAAFAGAIWLFAQIPTDQLLKGGAALLAVMAAVTIMGAILGKIGGQMLAGAFAVGILAVSILALAGALWLIAQMDMESIGKGLIATTVMLGVLVGVANLLKKSGPDVLIASLAIGVLSLSMLALAAALTVVAAIPFGQLASGAIVLLGIITVLALVSKLLGGTSAMGAVSILLMAGAMWILAQALTALAAVDQSALAGAVLALSVAFLALAVAAIAMNGAIVGAAGIALIFIAIGAAALMVGIAVALVVASIALFGPAAVLAAGGLEILAEAMRKNADATGPMLLLSVGLLAFGIAAAVAGAGAIVLGTGLVILGLGLAMIAAVGPIGALALKTLVNNISELADKSLALAGFGAALLVLGSGAVLLGAGLLAAGVGIMSFATAMLMLTALAGEGGVVTYLTQLMELIPVFATKVGEGIIAVLTVIGNSGAQIVATLTTLLMSVITAIQTVVPAIVETGVMIIMALIEGLSVTVPALLELITTVIMSILDQIEVLIPDIVNTGMNIVIALLDGIAQRLPDIMTKATDVIVAFIAGIGDNLPRIIQEGINTIIKFMEGIASGIRNNSARIRAAGWDILMALVEGIAGAVQEGISRVKNLVAQLANAIPDQFKSILGINSPSKVMYSLMGWVVKAVTNRLDDGRSAVERSSKRLANGAVEGTKNALAKMQDVLSQKIDINPTIKPVLDISDIEAKAGSINRALSASSLDLSASYGRAAAIQERTKASAEAREANDDHSESNITYIQQNYSPKALSRAEIYRQTKNQLSQKGKVNA